MPSIIKFQVIKGSFNEEPLSYILQIDEYKFLLDCGWNESFSLNIIDEYKKHVKEIDAVLLSFPDIEHIGALPYLVAKCGLNCPIYATIPVAQMGQMFMYDLLLSHTKNEDFDLFVLNDIDNAFDKIEQLSFRQKINLKDKGLGLHITPLPAAHMIGGTLWKISKEGEEEIVYAVDYNHHKERHLNSAFELSRPDKFEIKKPTLLITDAYNFLQQPKRRAEKPEKPENTFKDNVLKCLRGSGNVLVCTDTAGRVLELAHLVDQLWKDNAGLNVYSVALLNNVSSSVADFAKSQVEWMNEKIARTFAEDRYNPFNFKNIKLCDSLDDINNLKSPKLVLASTPDMECGFTRDLFVEWCSNDKNLIILTKRPAPNTLAKTILEKCEKSDPFTEKSVSIQIKKRVKLEGKELENHYKMLHEKAEKENRLKKAEELEAIDIDSSSDEEESEKIIPDAAFGDKYNKNKIKSGSMKRKTFPVFPFKEELIKWDDYGQIIKAEDYVQSGDMYGDSVTMQEPQEFENQQMNIAEEPGANAETVNEIPTKCVTETRKLNTNAKVLLIDFEGRSDGESIKRIISHIKPKNLIIIHGNEKATVELAEYFKRSEAAQIERIFTPREGEIIDATSESQMYQVKLKDSIVSALNFHKSKDYELAWVDGIIKAKNLQLDKSIIPSTTLQTSLELEYSLHALDKDCKLSKHKAVFVPKISAKLSDLKLILVRKGIQAEFHGGDLVCNGIIALKNRNGRIELEGMVSEEYYKIREILYEEFAIL